MTTAKSIASGENLGRGVFSSKYAKPARRGYFDLRIFLEKEDVLSISVDRLDQTSLLESTRIANEVAAKRGSNRSFYGWAVVKAKVAADKNRQVIASPLPDNAFHADILLPESTKGDRQAQRRHAELLADDSAWQERFVED